MNKKLQWRAYKAKGVEMETRKIKISEIEMNEDRNEGGKGDIESLARNLEKYGQI